MIVRILGTIVSGLFLLMMHFPPAQWLMVGMMLLVVLLRDGVEWVTS